MIGRCNTMLAGALRDVRSDMENLPRPEGIEAGPPASCLNTECLFESLRRNAPVARNILDSFEQADRRSFLHVVVPFDVKTFNLGSHRGKLRKVIAVKQIDQVIREIAQMNVEHFRIELRRASIRVPALSIRGARLKKEVQNLLPTNHSASG
jgi:hypothetical protein